MVKKVEEKVEEIKEKDTEDKKEDEIIKKEEKIEDVIGDEKGEKEIEASTSEAKIIGETELENDPWSAENWKETFPELFEKEITEKAEGLSKEDVVRICREQIKEWLKGVGRGDYPLPKSLKPMETTISNKTKDIEGLDEQLEKSVIAYKTYDEKFEDIAKTFVELKKEVQIIKDQPAEIFEKSLKEDKDMKYISPYLEKKDGSITINK